MRRISPFFSASACLLTLLLNTQSALAQWEDDGDDDIEGDEDEEEPEEPEEDEGDDEPEEPEEDEGDDEPEEPDEGKEDEGDTDPKESIDEEAASPAESECSGDDCPKTDDEKSEEDSASSAEEEADKEAKTKAAEARRARRREKMQQRKSEMKRRDDEPEATENSALEGARADEADNEEAVQAAMTDLPAPGPSLSPLTVTTSTFARLEIREGYDSLGVETTRRREGDAVFYRARLGLLTNPLPIHDGSDVRVKLSPQASGVFGQSADTFSTPDLGMYEGYMHFRSKRLETYIGRQKIEYGEGILFGEVFWHHVGRAFDGVKFHYKMNKGYVDFLGLQTAEVHPSGSERLLGGDEYIWGVYSGFGEYVGDNIETDAYVIAKSTVAQDALTDPASGAQVDAEGGTLFTVGARVKHKVDWLDYRFEAGLQFGESARSYRADPATLESPAAFAYQGSGEIGFSFGSSTRIGLGGDFASGDDLTTRGQEGWDPLFATAWQWLGNMDVIGLRTNVATGYLKLTRGLTESLTLDIDGHVFARPEFGGLGQVGDEKMAGVEVDTRLLQKLGEYASARGTYGLFIPQSGHYASDDLASYGEVEVRVEF